MEDRVKITNTELEIFPVVLGTVGMGDRIDQRDAFEIIDNYGYFGGNAIDTARVYAGGRSEEILGNYFKARGTRSNYIIISKGGHPRLESMHTGRMAEGDMRSDLEESLRALKTDYIDLYFYHRDDLHQPVSESIEIMERFVKEGKIRYYACSNWSPARIRQAEKYCLENGKNGFKANQALYNCGSDNMYPLADDTMYTMDTDMKKLHRETDILSMPYSGVCNGFFHRLFYYGEASVKDSPYYTEANLQAAKEIYNLAGNYKVSISKVLLGFFFYRDFKNCPIYGPSKSSQIQDLKDITRLPFKKDDFSFLQ